MCTRSAVPVLPQRLLSAALGLGWVSATVPALMPSVLFTRAAGGRSSSLSMCARQPMVGFGVACKRPAGRHAVVVHEPEPGSQQSARTGCVAHRSSEL
jgi:hypothetical protein